MRRDDCVASPSAHDLVGVAIANEAIGEGEVDEHVEGAGELVPIGGAEPVDGGAQGSRRGLGPLAQRRRVQPARHRPVVWTGEVGGAHRARRRHNAADLLGDEEQPVQPQLVAVRDARRAQLGHGRRRDGCRSDRGGMAQQSPFELAQRSVRPPPDSTDDVGCGDADVGDREVPVDLVTGGVVGEGVDADSLRRSEQLASPPIEGRFGERPRSRTRLLPSRGPVRRRRRGRRRCDG